ncbi:MAG: PAS domain-containing protein [Nitrospiraceae bacterium]
MILESWARCVEAGIRYEARSRSFRRVNDGELVQRLQQNRELLEGTSPYLPLISTTLGSLKHAVYLVDHQGIALTCCGNAPDLHRRVGLLPGYDWSERAMGTNGAGTALVTDRPIAVIGPEHFMRHLHDCASTASPIHDEAGSVIGALAIVTAATDATPERLNIIMQFASTIEQESGSIGRGKEIIRLLQGQGATLERHMATYASVGAAFMTDEPTCRELIDLLPAAVYVCDAKGVIVHYNRLAAQLWGREPRCGDANERFCGATTIYLPDGTLLTHDQMPTARVLRTGLPQDNRELILVRANGSHRTVLVNAVPLKDESREVIGAMNCMFDITDWKRAEDAVRSRDARLSHIFSSVPVVLYEAEVSEPFGRIWVSDNIEGLSGFPARRFIEDPGFWASRLHPDDRDQVLRTFATLDDHERLSSDYRWQHADGRYRWFLDQVVIQRDTNGRPTTILGTRQDMTEQRETRHQLQQSLDQLRMLSRRLELVREEEQRRLAREIHDELGVLMTTMKLDLAQMTGLLIDTGLETAAGSLRNKIASLDSTLDQTITVVQRIASDLRPGVLDDLGLIAAIQWQAKTFNARTGIHCDVIADTEDPQIDPEQATALFRICQEALTNVARHAHATSVVVRFSETAGQILLEIEDDGRGIPSDKLTDRMSLGLLGMRERASLGGGEVHIAGKPGNGTSIIVRMPTVSGHMNTAHQGL